LIHHDCTVNVFSNLPLSQANLKEFEDDNWTKV